MNNIIFNEVKLHVILTSLLTVCFFNMLLVLSPNKLAFRTKEIVKESLKFLINRKFHLNLEDISKEKCKKCLLALVKLFRGCQICHFYRQYAVLYRFLLAGIFFPNRRQLLKLE